MLIPCCHSSNFTTTLFFNKSRDLSYHEYCGTQVYAISSTREQHNFHYTLKKTHVIIVARGLAVCVEATVRLPSHLPHHLAFLTLAALDPDASAVAGQGQNQTSAADQLHRHHKYKLEILTIVPALYTSICINHCACTLLSLLFFLFHIHG